MHRKGDHSIFHFVLQFLIRAHIFFRKDWGTLLCPLFLNNFHVQEGLECHFKSIMKHYRYLLCRYEIFLCRILLAALDHNFHAFRELVEGRYKRVYSKRSKNWHVVPVKEEKSYKYWDILLQNSQGPCR